MELAALSFTEIPKVFENESDFYIVLRPDNYIAYIGKETDKVKSSLHYAK